MSEVTIIEADVEQSRDNPDYESLPMHSLYVHLIAGAAAGTMEHCVMYPIDSVKTRVQSLCPCPEKGGRTPVHSLLTLVRREGVWRPMRGVNAIAFGAAPAHALYFSVYERLKTRLTGNTRGHHNTWAYGVSGAAATLVHDAVMNPAEVVKQRMQMCSSPYNGSVECAKCVFRSEGWCAFYRSYTTQLLLNVPFQTVHFMTYEFMQQVSNPSHHYDPKSHVLAGALAGGLAAAVTNPLDVIKTVLNTQQRPAPLVAPPGKSILAGRSGTPVLTWARWRRLLAAEQQLHKPGGRATPRLDGKHCPASYREPQENDDLLDVRKGRFGAKVEKTKATNDKVKKIKRSKPDEALGGAKIHYKDITFCPAKNVHFAPDDNYEPVPEKHATEDLENSSSDEDSKCGVDKAMITPSTEAQLRTFLESNQDNLCGKFATMKAHAAVKKIEASMTAEERQEENRVRMEQMEQIFKMMSTQKEKFFSGNDPDESDMAEQMRLYALS